MKELPVTAEAREKAPLQRSASITCRNPHLKLAFCLTQFRLLAGQDEMEELLAMAEAMDDSPPDTGLYAAGPAPQAAAPQPDGGTQVGVPCSRETLWAGPSRFHLS